MTTSQLHMLFKKKTPIWNDVINKFSTQHPLLATYKLQCCEKFERKS
jgi:hypothetical protein